MELWCEFKQRFVDAWTAYMRFINNETRDGIGVYDWPWIGDGVWVLSVHGRPVKISGDRQAVLDEAAALIRRREDSDSASA